MKNNAKIYCVGGAVRDRLLGLPVQDHDWVVVGSTPEEMVAQGFQPVGKDFPVFLHPKRRYRRFRWDIYHPVRENESEIIGPKTEASLIRLSGTLQNRSPGPSPRRG